MERRMERRARLFKSLLFVLSVACVLNQQPTSSSTFACFILFSSLAKEREETECSRREQKRQTGKRLIPLLCLLYVSFLLFFLPHALRTRV